jgi:toxin ParE1/3/4
MSKSLKFQAGASREISDATAWYHARRPGLEQEFLAEIDRCLDLIAQHPLRYPLVHGDIRRLLVKRFPYGVFYRVKKIHIEVLAVFHGQRDPADWQTR